MPASDAIRRRAKPVNIVRPGQGSYVDGKWQDGTPTDIALTAAIQPINGKERALLPEGIRETGQYRVWSLIELRTDDQLTINGTPCVILAVEPWTDHYRAIAGDRDAST